MSLRLPLALALLLAVPALGGCVVATVAVTGVKAGTKVAGTAVGVAADGVGAVGCAATGCAATGCGKR